MEPHDGAPRCTCGGHGICQTCVLAEYEGELPARMMATALDATVAALMRAPEPSNVVSLPGYSRKVAPRLIDREPTDDELYNRAGVEGGIGYTVDAPGSLGENDLAALMAENTLYHILQAKTDKDGGEIYVPHSANVGASSAEQALRSSVTETGRYVAIPRRNFVPVDVKIETKTTVKIGGAS